MKSSLLRAGSLVFLALMFGASAFGQWPNGYAYRATLTLAASKVSNTDQVNFPVLISGLYTDLKLSTQGGRVTNGMGYDIIFSSDANGATTLPFERESYSGTTGQVAFWVKVPLLSHTVDTVVYMFYGNAAVTMDPSNKTAVWDANYVGVWHMGDSAASLTVGDSTSNANNGTAVANTSTKSAPGLAGGTLNFNGTTDRISTAVSIGKTFTWEAWVNSPTITNSSFQSVITLDGASYMLMGVRSGAGSFWAPGSDSLAGPNLGVTGLTNNTWYHLVFVRAGDSNPTGYATYLNGAFRGQAASGVWNKSANFTFGARPDTPGQAFNGKLDEIRISKTVRSADWITTEYRNLSSPSTFYSASWTETSGIAIPPSLSVSQSSLTYNAFEGGIDPPAKSVNVTNAGAALNWTATSTVPWITLSTSAVGGGLPALSGTGASTIWIQVSNAGSTAAGSPYTGAINFTAAGAAPPLPSISVSLAVGAAPVPGSSWGNGYLFRGTITVPFSQIPNTDQANFPVLVSGIYPDLGGPGTGRVQNPNGYDIIFTSDPEGSNPLPYERAAYSANGQVAFWVKVPNLSHTTNTSFYVFYGNASVATDQSNKAGVWDSNFVGVWHMGDNAPSLLVSDSTANANNGTAAANTNTRSTSGSVSTALSFNGTTDRITTSVSSGKTFTWEAWVNSATMATTPHQSLITLSGTSYMLMDTQNGGGYFWSSDGLAGSTLGITGLGNNSWYHLVFVRSGDSSASGYKAYLNGVFKGQAASGVWANTANFAFGTRLDLAGQGFSGKLDEIRISKTARSADWIATEYRNLNNPFFYSASWGQTIAGLPPTLSVAPLSLSYLATMGLGDPAAQSIAISNAGDGALNWTASADQSWINLSATSGTGPQSVNVFASIDGLGAGVYSGTVTINAPAASPSSQTVNISLTITPTFDASPSSLSFTAASPSSKPAPQSLVIAAPSSSSWTAIANQPWITLSLMPLGGAQTVSSDGARTIWVQVAADGLTPGTSLGSITFSVSGIAVKTVDVSLLLATGAGSGLSHFVAPTGSSAGDGSMSRPWDLQTALNQPASVHPGDSIWVMGGTYFAKLAPNGQFTSNLTGTSALPIVVRNYNGQRATIDAKGGAMGLFVNGSYTWFWGLEVFDSTTQRQSQLEGSGANTNTAGVFLAGGTGNKFINMIIHDAAQGFFAGSASVNTEFNGNLVYNNGWNAPDRGHGHGFYVQNQAPSYKKIIDNIIFQGFGEGIQCYGSPSAAIQNFLFDGNTLFNAGILTGVDDYNLLVAGGGGGPQNITVTNNYTYHAPTRGGLSALPWGFDTEASNLFADNNYWIGGNPALDVHAWTGATFTHQVLYGTLNAGGLNPGTYTWDNNTYYNPSTVFGQIDGHNQTFATWRSSKGLDANSTLIPAQPTGTWSFARPNQYEPGRGNITIYNWDLLGSVMVDVSNILTVGRQFSVLNAQNIFGTPIVSGTYNGGSISIPMTGLTVAPAIGNVSYQPGPVGPQFGAFVIVQQ